jgi:hypothetical protein
MAKRYPFLELLLKYAEKRAQNTSEDSALWQQVYLNALAEYDKIVGKSDGEDGDVVEDKFNELNNMMEDMT